MKSFNIGDLKIPVPVIQGGMGIGISLSGLASAVANMGGVGVISSVGIGLIANETSINYKNNNIAALRSCIQRAKEQTAGVLGVNIMSVLTNFSDLVKTSIEEGIDIIFSGAGLPLDLPQYLDSGIKTKLVPIVSSARAASILCNKWQRNFNYLPDAFVVEGPKAGGHLGFKINKLQEANNCLERLISEVVDLITEMKKKYNKTIPVIAAGGIYSGNDMFQIIAHGATAVQLGTRFVATKECDASHAFKQAFVDACDTDVSIIKSPVGLPGRVLDNKFLQDATDGKKRPTVCKYNCIKSCNPKTTTFCIADALMSAYQGNLDNGFVFTGTNVGKVKMISTVKNVFEDLKREYQEAKIKNINK